MRTLRNALISLPVLIAPLFAGALVLQLGNPSDNPEALAKRAVLVTKTAACRSPEKTVVSATAEGVINGMRKSIPLQVIALSTPGTYGIAGAWPDRGTWAVKVVATNPQYKDYAPSVVVPVRNKSVQLAAVKNYYHAPTDAEVAMSLNY